MTFHGILKVMIKSFETRILAKTIEAKIMSR